MLPEKYGQETVYRFHNLSSMKVLDIDGLAINTPGAKTSQWTITLNNLIHSSSSAQFPQVVAGSSS